MNRLIEYQELLQELDKPVPELEHTLGRAHAKRKRRNRVTRPIVGMAASLVLFVGLVNFCSPVAYACSKVPFLCDLAEAVTFSKSLTDAVDNEYLQPLELSQTVGDITATVEYLIVDQKQVNVFFRLDSEVHSKLGVEPAVRSEDGGFCPCSYGLNDWNVSNGELQSVTIDFVDENVPDRLRLKLKVYDQFPENQESETTVTPEENVNDVMFEEHGTEELEYLAEFDFLLEFDPSFTAAGKKFLINQTVELEGKNITFTEMEVYPTHLRVNVLDSLDNSAWLTQLYFYIETEDGMKFETISNGITATGSTESSNMTSFRAESSYFYEAEQLKIVITGAEWLNKDMEKVYVNLKTGETGLLPEGVTFDAATKESGGWLVSFEADERKDNAFHQLFTRKYYDAEGNEYEINTWSSTMGKKNAEGEVTAFIECFPLKGYFEDEVWLSPKYSHVWTAEKPIEILVQ